MTESGSTIRFDRAEYANASEGGSAGRPCDVCRRPLGAQYWKWQTQIACAACRDRLAAALERSRSPTALVTALAQGTAAAMGCGLVYAFFVAATGTQFAIATIAIGYVVARVVRRATHGVGGRRAQVLAVILTYFGASMAYAGEALPSLRDAAANPAELLRGVLHMIALPVLVAPRDGLLAFIVGVGLWEAWTLSRGASPTLEGPFRVAAPPAPQVAPPS